MPQFSICEKSMITQKMKQVSNMFDFVCAEFELSQQICINCGDIHPMYLVKGTTFDFIRSQTFPFYFFQQHHCTLKPKLLFLHDL